MPFTYEHARPAVTVDVALFAAGARGELQLLLIRRGSEPFAGRWALPGGFVDPDEDLDVAARREVLEETGVRVGRLVQLGAYGKPGRDPRGRTISVVFLAGCDRAATNGTAGDDAAACDWFAALRPPPLAFDHKRILRDARLRLAEIARDRTTFASLLFGARSPAVADAVRRAALPTTAAKRPRRPS
ncbi:MAG TPA: NUDIX hydrolase [Planctomycetota bacterium]|nr:NUDIX hydrolase [Planctomycetota bacterium]